MACGVTEGGASCRVDTYFRVGFYGATVQALSCEQGEGLLGFTAAGPMKVAAAVVIG